MSVLGDKLEAFRQTTPKLTGTLYRIDPRVAPGKSAPTPKQATAFTYSDAVFSGNAADFYGLTMPVSCGQRAITGVPIWATPIENYADGRRIGSVAYAFGVPMVIEDELIDTTVLRLWMNGKLVYDVYSSEGWNTGPGLHFSLYRGFPNQNADPAITAWLNAAGYPTIAFRGRIYIVFYNLPLHTYELNVYPFIRAELLDTFGGRANVLEFDQLAGAYTTPSIYHLAPDWEMGRLYTWEQDASSDTWVRVFDISTNAELWAAKILYTDGTTNFESGHAGPITSNTQSWYCEPYYHYMLTVSGPTANSQKIISFNPETGNVTGEFGSTGSGTADTTTKFVSTSRMATCRIDSELTTSVFIICLSLLDDLGILEMDSAGALSYVWHDAATVNTFYSDFSTKTGTLRAITQGDLLTDTEGGTFFAATTREVYRGCIYRDPSNGGWQVRFDLLYTAPTGHLIHELFWIPNSNDFMIWNGDSLSGVWYVERHELASTFVGLTVPTIDSNPRTAATWHTELITAPWANVAAVSNSRRNGWQHSNLRGAGTIAYCDDNVDIVSVLNIANGDLTEFDLSDWKFYVNDANEASPITLHTNAMWNASGSYFIGYADHPSADFRYDLAKVWPASPPGDDITLGQILRWMLLYNGFTDSQISITNIGDIVLGSLVQEVNLSLWDVFAQMETIFRFDRYESEGMVKLSKALRGASLSITYTMDPSADLLPTSGTEVAVDNDTAFETARDWNEDAPAILEMQYLDATSEYIVNLARAKRTRYPIKTTQNTGKAEYSVPIIMTPIEALNYATKALYDLYEKVNTHSMRVSKRHLTMEPGDVVALTINSLDYVMKVSEGTINADDSQTIGMRGFSNVDSLTLVGETPIADAQVVPGPNISQFLYLDTPPLTYGDAAVVDAGIHQPTLVASYGQYGWVGARLLLADAPIGPYTEIYRHYAADGEGVIGITSTALPYHEGQATDSENTITVRLIVGRTTGFATTGYVLVGKRGRWEYMYYASATDNGDNNWTLGTLTRGLRHTHTAAASHISGDYVVVVSETTPIVDVGFTVSSLNEIAYAKVLGIGADLTQSLPSPITVNGNHDKPFAPISLKAATSASDIALSWLRVSRLESHLTYGDTDGPLDFATEEYELEIISTAGAVLRTVTGLATNAYTYLSADITTDFGTAPASLRFKVYQISPVVGRGFVADDTVDVS